MTAKNATNATKNSPNKTIYKCKKCSKLAHTNCDKTTKSEISYFIDNPDDFVCKSCSTCRICNKYVASNHRGIECNICNNWIYAKCNRLDIKDYDNFQTDESLKFICMQCLKETLPTLVLTPMKLKLTMDGTDLIDDRQKTFFLTTRNLHSLKKSTELSLMVSLTIMIATMTARYPQLIANTTQ